ncbi:class I SAM-dependent methyltransferase [Rhodococcus opacus]|uniref:Class I SAM-dependent methyltransferase n=1 Tax=Rhodococcus opacus TaxID=37919 RepID=A0AAX3YE56_RHOOP|nr:class I SAM-dependent methyltransferase [Rhodococcus opacus]MCZ4583614.1 class I SAM-dependent methyltransferase [Rhodococcus opacus]WLF47336.1 class I SAM-dependent methyltransferase [Rhodococcus opacus]
MADDNRKRVDATTLTGVPATMMWTLRNRAVEASRPDGTLVDPLAVTLYETLDYPYENFGKPSQSHALRARAFDDEIRAFLADHPGGTVVALGEGLQTSYWRIGDPDVRWVSIDLPEVVALRRQLLPDEPNVTTLAVSALDRSWMDHVDTGRAVFVSAEGLLMYLPRRRVAVPDRRLRPAFPQRPDDVRLGTEMVEPQDAERNANSRRLLRPADAVPPLRRRCSGPARTGAGPCVHPRGDAASRPGPVGVDPAPQGVGTAAAAQLASDVDPLRIRRLNPSDERCGPARSRMVQWRTADSPRHSSRHVPRTCFAATTSAR